jgi:hypothetical protein
MVVGFTMKYKPLGIGRTVKIKPQVQGHGGKVGRVVYEGQELGWRVVKVKFDDLPQPVSFTPAEVETR